MTMTNVKLQKATVFPKKVPAVKGYGLFLSKTVPAVKGYGFSFLPRPARPAVAPVFPATCRR